MKEDNKEDAEDLLVLVNKYIGSEANCSTCTCTSCPKYPNKFPILEEEEPEPTTGCVTCPGHYHYEGDKQCSGWHHIPTCKPPVTEVIKPSTGNNCGCNNNVVTKPPVIEDDDTDSGLGSFSCTTKK